MVFGIAKIHGVDDHLDIGAVLPRIAPLRDVDELDSGFVERFFVFFMYAEIRVGFLDDDLAFLDDPRQNAANVELIELGFRSA